MRAWFGELAKSAAAILTPLRRSDALESSFSEYLIASTVESEPENEQPAGDGMDDGTNGEAGVHDNGAILDEIQCANDVHALPFAIPETGFDIAHVDLWPERIIPLTRRRLRRREPITWPALHDGDPRERTSPERLALLTRILEWSRPEHGPILARAYAEEQPAERLAILRAMMSGRYSEAPDVFRAALRAESEMERGLAIDGLARSAARDELIFAFGDRVEALAAKAALAYAGSRRRSDLIQAIAPHVEEGRLAAILALLAGTLE